MELLIMGLIEAWKHRPEKPTYAIQIFGSSTDNQDEMARYSLKTPRYSSVKQYVFEDIWPENMWMKGKLFDEDLAMRVITDFKEQGAGCESLLVHCSRGKNRSPAVGIALNEMFGLGHDTGALKEIHPASNWYVYATLMETAKKMSLYEGDIVIPHAPFFEHLYSKFTSQLSS